MLPARFASRVVRGKITEFSEGSGRRMRAYLRTCTAEYKVFGTLTYPVGLSLTGPEIKRHLHVFKQSVKRYCDNSAFSLFWFLEFTQSGVPHFHFFCTDFLPKEWLARRWYEIVGTEDLRHRQAGTRIEGFKRGRDGTIAYASKYAAKQYQKMIPEGAESMGRFWGVCGLRTVVAADTFVSSRLLKVKAISERVETIIERVRNYKEKGRAIIYRDDQYGLVAVLKDEAISLGLLFRSLQFLVAKHGTPRDLHTAWMFQGAEIDDD